MAVRIVTDSTCDLPAPVAASLNITLVPLSVHFEEETRLDGVEIGPDEFYRRLADGPLPRTSQPSVGAFAETYRQVGHGAEGILSIHISSQLSGTCNSATGASQNWAGACPVEVVDSGTTSLALGMVAVAAARKAREGASLQDLRALTQEAIERTHVFFFVDTLEYLAKGGRIGRAQALLGSLLQLRPVLTIREGEVHPLDRARTRGKAMQRLAQIVSDLGPVEEAAVVHSTTPEDAAALAETAAALCPEGARQVLVGRFSPVVGTYAGPGAVGIAVRTRA